MMTTATAPTYGDMITCVSGIKDGVAWRIETVMERRTGFRVFIAGKFVATFGGFVSEDILDELIALEQDKTAVGAAALIEA